MKKRGLYNLFQKLSAVFLISTLAWLTISIAFVSDSQARITKQVKADYAQADGQEEDSNPLTSTTEEKCPSPGSLTEEFIHEQQAIEHLFTTIFQRHIHYDDGTYTAFHGELHAPPPNQA